MTATELRTVTAGNLKALRTLRGLTQSQLAERAGLKQSHIAQLEGGSKAFTEKTLTQLAEALQTTPWALQTPDCFAAAP